MNKKTALGIGLILAVGAGFAVFRAQKAASISATQTSISFAQSPFCHNMYPGPFNDPAVFTYSGRHIVHGQEWGAYALNADKVGGEFKMVSWVATSVHQGSCPTGTNYQTPAHVIYGDCYGSFTALAATPGTEKWVVGIGVPPMCKEVGTDPPRTPGQVQVLRLDGPTGLRYAGQIFDPDLQHVAVRDIRIIGDTAYIKQTRFSTTFSIYDLNTMLKTGTTTTPPAFTAQDSIDGYTYSIMGVIPTPQPVPFCGPCSFIATRKGGPVTTPTAPFPTGTPTATPQVTACTPREVTRVVTVIQTKIVTPTNTPHIGPAPTKTITPCIGPVSGCPTPSPSPHIGPAPTKTP